MRRITRVALLLMLGVLVASCLRSGLWSPSPSAVGKPAPDTEGTDADGVAFALNDYRGKVVLLDFWRRD
jgi:hypothetical protein